MTLMKGISNLVLLFLTTFILLISVNISSSNILLGNVTLIGTDGRANVYPLISGNKISYGQEAFIRVAGGSFVVEEGSDLVVVDEGEHLAFRIENGIIHFRIQPHKAVFSFNTRNGSFKTPGIVKAGTSIVEGKITATEKETILELSEGALQALTTEGIETVNAGDRIVLVAQTVIDESPAGENGSTNPHTASASTYSLGDMKVENKVEVTLSDGSVVELNDGETHPIYEGMTINTLEDGKATLSVKGGRYVIEPESIFVVSKIEIGNTALTVTTGNQGEVCYCFEPGAPFLVDTPQANTSPHEGVTQAGSYNMYVQGRTDFTEGLTSAFQIENQADFQANHKVSVLDPGDAISNPQSANPYDAFESRSGCCAPPTPLFLLPVIAGTAITTAVMLTTIYKKDRNASNIQ